MPKFGVIGAGRWGQIHAKVYAEDPSSELVAVCDEDEGKARSVAERFGARWFLDYREMLEEAEVDAVSVATPDFLHFEPTMAAIEAGKHVLVEKPLAMEISQCEEMISAAEGKGLILMVDFHNRWNPPFALAKDAIGSGEIGDIVYIYSRLSDTIFVPTKMLGWAGKSSVLWFLGSHVVDLLLWLLDDFPIRVRAVKREGVLKSMGVDTPDLFVSLMEFPKGAVAVMENSWILPEGEPTVFDMKFEIIGSKGRICIDTSHHGAFSKSTADGISFPDIMAVPRIHGKAVGFAVESIRHFVECVRYGKRPMVCGEDGLRATRVLKAIESSSQSQHDMAGWERV
jgi:predicted dehydrogenase